MPKIGEGSFKGFMKQGLAEIRNAASIEGSVAAPVDPGIWGSPTTQGEAASARRDVEVPTTTQPASVLAAYEPATPQVGPPETEPPEPELSPDD